MAGFDSNKYLNGPRRLSVNEASFQRQNGPQASSVISGGRRLSRQEATDQMPQGGYQMGGWNTSGVGPGSDGYRGSGRIDAHIYGPKVPRTGPISPDYGASFGGLNEFHQNQQGASEWDRLQNRAEMDRIDATGSRYAQQKRAAQMAGDEEGVAYFDQMLQDRLAQGMAGGGGNFSNQSGGQTMGQSGGVQDMYHSPGERRFDAGGNLWQWNERSKKGEMISSGPTMADVPHGTMGGSGNFSMRTPYGKASVSQTEMPTTFTRGNYSAPIASNPSGVESAIDFFQNAANRQRMGNSFASPQVGFNGAPDNELGNYAQRMMMAKNRLKG